VDPIENQVKRILVSDLIDALQPTSVLEVGCGDGGITIGLPIKQYSGIGQSQEALRRAKLGRPDGKFLNGTLAEYSTNADLTVCLDVLGNESSADAYRELVELLWRSAKQGLLVSGLENPAGSTDDPTLHFHEPLSQTLQRVAPEAEIYPVARESHVTTFVILRPPMTRHPRDYSAATLGHHSGRHPDPLLLMAIRTKAWRTLGFYPDHGPRLWEYPVVAKLIAEQLPIGSRIVDVGAGTTPLTPFLTSCGYVVDTVDPSTRQRHWPPQSDWNEWGFLDYGKEGLAHRSWNCTLDKLPAKAVFDGAFSVSVIEHVPAASRRDLMAELSARIRPGGVVVLTVDLIHGRDDLWNRNLGVEVEDPSFHGTFQDVVAEGAEVGLQLFRDEIVRESGDDQVDIGLLAMRQRTVHQVQ
jgi:SAM-dependent methyltransferase